MKVMLLAAGRGQRMQELTDHCPKPLLRCAGKYLIEYQLEAFVAAGFDQFVINVSYLAEQIIDRIGDGRSYGVEIRYSFEPEVGALETGGGVQQALPLLGDQPFIVSSSDIITDFPYETLHQVRSPLHLVLVDNPQHHREGDFGFDRMTQKLSSNAPKLNYAGICVMDPQLFADAKPGFLLLRDIFVHAVNQNMASAEYFNGQWHNLGTKAQLQVLDDKLCAKRNSV
jgi:N-acetyl-alpha-D-muramate 1-phosphate uridylyltransferase